MPGFWTARASRTLRSAMDDASAADSATRAPFGTLPDGRPVEAITLKSGEGVSATCINYGATLQSLEMPDRNGRRADVALGYASLGGYLANRDYIGSSVGRFANRIDEGRFTLDGKVCQATLNDHGHSLHGGVKGFDQALWQIVDVRETPRPAVTMRHVSPDGDEGYPGTLTASVTYSLAGRELRIEYEAMTDRPTIASITNHAYWNLAGEGASAGAMGHVLMIPAEHYMPVTERLIPTGELRSVAGTAFDFRQPTVVGARLRSDDPQLAIGRGYDHNFVFARGISHEPRLLARLEDPVSGRGLELWSNQPGMQFYSGNSLDGTRTGKSGGAYRPGDGIALEPQLFPDTPNQPAFGSARLAPGQTYRNLILYRLFSH